MRGGRVRQKTVQGKVVGLLTTVGSWASILLGPLKPPGAFHSSTLPALMEGWPGG